MPIALITGASRGLGATFAARLAAQGHDLVLVARDRVALEQVATQARRFGVHTQVLVADLTNPDARAAVERRLADPLHTIDMLVNNAATESQGEFVDADPVELQAEIDLNISTVLHLTHAVLPGMIARGRGSVVNIASFAGYLPSSGTAYAATKAWVLAFTDTIAPSLSGTGVGMVAVCAGRMRTGKHEAPIKASALWLDPATVVDTCLADLARGRILSTPGLAYRMVVGTLELPRRTLRRFARITGRGREQRPPRTGSAPTPLSTAA